MANNNLIDAREVVKSISDAWDAHTQKVNASKEAMAKLTSEYNKLPSQYRDNLNKTVESQNNLSNSTKKLTERTREEIIENRILNQQKDVLIKSNTKLAGAYAQLSAKAQIASKNLRDYIVAGRQANQTNKEFERGLSKLQREFDGYNRRLLQADKAVGAWGRTNQRVISGATQLMSAFGIATGLYLAVDIGRSIFNTTREIQSLDLALKNVTGTEENFISQQAFLLDISERYGAEIKSLTSLYTQFYVSAKNKVSGQEIQAIFEGITKSGSALGITQERMAKAFLAINQMMSKGTVQAEELRQQLAEAIPGSVEAMIRAFQKLHPELNITEQDFYNIQKTGKFMGKELKIISSEVIPLYVKEIEKMTGADQMTRFDTLNAKVNRLSNEWTSLVRNMNDSDTSGIGIFFGYITTGLTNLLILINRASSSWGTLQDKSQKEGQSMGSNWFSNFTKGMTKEQIQKWYDENISLLLKSQGDLQNKVIGLQNELKKIDKFSLRNPFAKSPKDINKEIEGYKNEIGQIEGVINSANAVLNENTVKTNENAEASEKTTEQLKKEEEARRKLAEALERELKLQSDLNIAKAERELYLLNGKLNDDKLYFNERLALLDKVAQKETEIQLLKYQENIRLHKDSNKQMEIDAINFKTAIDDINKDRVDNGLKELERYYKEFNEIQEKYEGDGLRLSLFGDDPKGDFEKWKEGADNAKKSTDELKDSTKQWILSFKDAFVGDMGFTTLFDILEGKIEKFGTNFTNTFLGITEVIQETMNFLSQSNRTRAENDLNALDIEYNQALAMAGDNQQAQEKLKEQYDKRQKDIKRRQFEADKKIAKANVIIDMTQAIMSVFAEYPYLTAIPMSIALGAIGAYQISQINQQQLPEYFKGTDNAKEGWAWTNERGAEIHTDKHGNIKDFGTDKGAKLTKMSSGDKVYTADQTKQILFNRELNNILAGNKIDNAPTIINNSIGLDKETFSGGINHLAQTIKNKTEFIETRDKSGYRRFKRNQSATTEYYNNYSEFKTTDV